MVSPRDLDPLPSARIMNQKKKRLVILVGVLISAGFLWFSLQGTDFSEIGASLAGARLWLMLPLLAGYAVFYWLKNLRWWMLLRPMRRATQREIFSPLMIGFMGNNVLPAHLGEFVRMYLGARKLRLRNSQVLATIVLERMLDFLAVVFFLGLVLLVGRNVPPDLVRIGWVTAVVGFGFVVAAAVYATWTRPFLTLVRRLTFFLPARLRGALLTQLELGSLGLHSLRDPRLLVGVVATSVLQWAALGVSIYCAIVAIGVEVRMSAAFVTLAATTFGVTLPAAPGFLGSIQAAFVVGLAAYGVSRADAFAASAFFHVPTYLSVTLLGLWLLRRSGYRLGQIQEQAETAQDSAQEAAPEDARSESLA